MGVEEVITDPLLSRESMILVTELPKTSGKLLTLGTAFLPYLHFSPHPTLSLPLTFSQHHLPPCPQQPSASIFCPRCYPVYCNSMSLLLVPRDACIWNISKDISSQARLNTCSCEAAVRHTDAIIAAPHPTISPELSLASQPLGVGGQTEVLKDNTPGSISQQVIVSSSYINIVAS